VAGTYEKTVDRESAYEMLAKRTAQAPADGGGQAGAEDGGLVGDLLAKGKEVLFGRTGPRGGQYDGMVQQVVKGEMRRMGRELLRGALGGLLGGKRR